jgi:hypothetical protein
MTSQLAQSDNGMMLEPKSVSAFIDWISVTHKGLGSAPMPDSLPKESVSSTGHNGYTSAKKYLTGVVEMLNPQRPDMGIHVIYSGKVLDTIQARYGVTRDEILRFHTTLAGRIARIDFAIDIRGYNLNLNTLWEQLEQGQAITKSSHTRTQSGYDKGDTVYVGSRKTRKKLLRAYDKAKETGDFVSDYKRVELECRQDVARNATALYQDNNYQTDTILAMVRSFCDFPLCDIWSSILTVNAEKIPVGDKSIGNTEKWLLEQVAPAFARALVSNPDFYEVFKDRVEFEYNSFLAQQEQ